MIIINGLLVKSPNILNIFSGSLPVLIIDNTNRIKFKFNTAPTVLNIHLEMNRTNKLNENRFYGGKKKL